MNYDLVIRGGTVIDGSGNDPVVADVGIIGTTIAAVGSIEDTGREEIDATGLLVTPGFVDIHTHYDGQAVWTSYLSPSSLHGVTTVVAGNCGVGFAPCRPEDHQTLIRLMEGVEDIPGVVLEEGLDWKWETFPEFLDKLDSRAYDIDLATQIPHGALRVYVMGERGARREPATPDDVVAMATLAEEGIKAGALGFSTSRTLNHRASDGQHTPMFTAGEDELQGIADALAKADAGVLQVVSDFRDQEAEFAMLRRIVERSGRPLSISMVQAGVRPNQWREMLAHIEDATSAGLAIKAQVCGRPVGIIMGLETTLNPLLAYPSYREISDLPLAAKLERLHDPVFVANMLAEDIATKDWNYEHTLTLFSDMYPLDDPPDYEPTADQSLAAEAERLGVEPIKVALERMLADGGKGLIYAPFLNYVDGSLEASLEMMRHKDTLLGLGDGGAHVGTICDGSFPTTMLSYWTRDRQRGDKLPLPGVIRAQSRDTAVAVGLLDRGLVAPGYKADLNLIDYDRVQLRRPHLVSDLPAGGRRLMQEADGYVATIVSGQVTYRNGQSTGALPGKLIRGHQADPSAHAR